MMIPNAYVLFTCKEPISLVILHIILTMFFIMCKHHMCINTNFTHILLEVSN